MSSSAGQDVAQLGEIFAQTTLSEWNAVEGVKTCVDCHYDGHRLRGVEDLAFTASAIDVVVVCEGDEVSAEATATHRVGHAVPTGDSFRRWTIELCFDQSCERAAAVASLRRRFAPGVNDWRVVGDSRLVPSGPPVRVSSPAVSADGSPVSHWRVVMHLAEDDLATPEDVVVVRSGEVDCRSSAD